MLDKNDIVELQITDMSEQGEGIGPAGGYMLLVKDGVVGDFVRACVTRPGKSYGYARILEVLRPSENRMSPRCPIAGPCGGCQLQAMSYEAQLAFKQNKVRQHLRRIGGFSNIEVLPVIGMEQPWEYRNKFQSPVGQDKSGRLIAGFYAQRSHRIVETPHCHLGSPVIDQIRRLVLAHMEKYRIPAYNEETHSGTVRHILARHAAATGEWMVSLVINADKLPRAEALVAKLRELPGMTDISLNINKERTNVILGRKMKQLYGPGYITDKIGRLRFRISPQAFYQVNPVQTAKLYETALDYAGLTGRETVWDLYCGIGTISLFLAQRARKVYGVEIVPAAIANARENAALNHIDNAEFFVGKAEEVVLPGERPDVIVVDPPRKGCDKSLLETILRVLPARVVYVSCDSATLARDLKILCEKDYEIRSVQPVDMFAQTVGVESVCLLSRVSNRKPDSKVEIEIDTEEYYMMIEKQKIFY